MSFHVMAGPSSPVLTVRPAFAPNYLKLGWYNGLATIRCLGGYEFYFGESKHPTISINVNLLNDVAPLYRPYHERSSKLAV